MELEFKFLFLQISSFVLMTSSRPLQMACLDSNIVDILGQAISESGKLPLGVEVSSSKDGRGYRFHPEARLLSVPASSILMKCKNFPTEFSLIVTIKLSSVRNDNQYLLTLLAPDKSSVLFCLKIQRDSFVMDYLTKEGKQSVRFKEDRILDDKWHTLILTVTPNDAKLKIDCTVNINKLLKIPFPNTLDTRRSNFYIASRRSTKNRFTGSIKQLRFVPGSDVSLHMCTSTANIPNLWWNPHILSPDLNKTSSDKGNVVIFNNQTQSPIVCDSRNKGKLLYVEDYGRLDVCADHMWKKIASSQVKLNYVEEYSEVRTKSKTLDIEIFDIPEHGLFLATANQGRDRSMDSIVFKWNGEQFVPYQNITTDSAQNWEHFVINGEHFLAVANQGADEKTPAAISAVYRWDFATELFVPHQFFRTFSAQSWKSFTINDKHFLAVANYGGSQKENGVSSLRELSWIMVWDYDHRAFVSYQSIETIGGVDFEYFEVEGKHFLAVANSFDGDDSRTDSVIYKWEEAKFIPFQYIETVGAHDFEYFTINKRHFLAVANYYDYRKKSYILNSKIYELNQRRNKFSNIQDIKTYGALDVEFFAVGNDNYIIIASSSDSNQKLDSVIYKWQGVERFVPVHNVKAKPCSDWEEFITDDGEQYLVSANVKGKHNKILHLKTYV